ncbi:MAG: trypsin-like peptidase domain-containing protein [Anaerolineales bacterium]|nr:trypsin-like peptidase domain-containing protein [Anaerolineales bacterium]
MKPTFLKSVWGFLSILVLAAVACRGGAPNVTPKATAEPSSNDSPSNAPASSSSNLIAATVQIFGMFDKNGKLVQGYVGSGTILSPSGMILTNAHVASPASQGDDDYEPDALMVGMILSEDKPAVPSYMARVVAVDGFLDLAIIQITADAKGSPIDTSSLNLPYVQRGDSDSVHVGDTIHIFGFPAIGGNTITFTQGTVSGFSPEDQLGDRAWIKTDATISGGNSGGLAADANGRIIGVPTIAAASRDTDTSDCRVVQDTNGDGRVDQNDSCVPIGGFLNGIRPIKLAQALIDAAVNGKQYTSPYYLPGSNVATNPGSGNESATNFVWMDTSNAASQQCDFLEQNVNAYDSSALCIVAGFDYSGMTPGEPIMERWYNGNEKIGEFNYAWDAKENGLAVTALTNGGDAMPAGKYRLELYAGDSVKLIGQSSPVVVGGGESGGSQPPPSNADTITIYGIVYDSATNKPIPGAYVFVLTPGTTYDDWANAEYTKDYIVSYLQTDASGKYKITGIPYNTQFTLVYAAKGYYDASTDILIAKTGDPNSYELNAGLSK